MPLYEYKCQDCGREFEELTSFARANDVACIYCGSRKVERLMSTFSDSGSGSESQGEFPTCFSGG